MYIIDKNKDYYDHYSYIYGVDKKITYDRRKSRIIDNPTLVSLSEQNNPVSGPKSIRFILLEIGCIQYLIKLYNFVIEDDLYKKVQDFSVELVQTFNDYKHRFNSPVSIRGVRVNYLFNWKYWKDASTRYNYITDGSYDEVITRIHDNAIENPILANTKLTSLIDGEKVWRDIQNYISSLDNDKDVSTPMTDVERAEIHGFDRETSFRNPIK